MKRSVFTFLLAIVFLLGLTVCTKLFSSSTFSIQFIDVGQGDSALVECDGHYMLIDGGNKSAGDKVYNVLQEKDISQLDYLVISHLHEDHYGGLIKALTYTNHIKNTICNADSSNNRKSRN